MTLLSLLKGHLITLVDKGAKNGKHTVTRKCWISDAVKSLYYIYIGLLYISKTQLWKTNYSRFHIYAIRFHDLLSKTPLVPQSFPVANGNINNTFSCCVAFPLTFAMSVMSICVVAPSRQARSITAAWRRRQNEFPRSFPVG